MERRTTQGELTTDERRLECSTEGPSVERHFWRCRFDVCSALLAVTTAAGASNASDAPARHTVTMARCHLKPRTHCLEKVELQQRRGLSLDRLFHRRTARWRDPGRRARAAGGFEAPLPIDTAAAAGAGCSLERSRP